MAFVSSVTPSPFAPYQSTLRNVVLLERYNVGFEYMRGLGKYIASEMKTLGELMLGGDGG